MDLIDIENRTFAHDGETETRVLCNLLFVRKEWHQDYAFGTLDRMDFWDEVHQAIYRRAEERYEEGLLSTQRNGIDCLIEATPGWLLNSTDSFGRLARRITDHLIGHPKCEVVWWSCLDDDCKKMRALRLQRGRALAATHAIRETIDPRPRPGKLLRDIHPVLDGLAKLESGQ